MRRTFTALALLLLLGPTAPATTPAHGAAVTWIQVFSDNFAQTVPLGAFPSSARWSPYPYPWRDTSGNGTYWPKKGLSVHDGYLDIWLHSKSGVHVTEAPQAVFSSGSKYQLYGKYSVRWKMRAIPGYKVAWLLWPQSKSKLADGEIDFPEADLDGISTVEAFMHHTAATSGGDQDAYRSGVVLSDGAWHTTTVVWRPDFCRFIIDGAVIGTSTVRVPETSMKWVLQSETQLSGGAPSNTASGHIRVDWVKIWKLG